jgi:hypothetical protein
MVKVVVRGKCLAEILTLSVCIALISSRCKSPSSPEPPAPPPPVQVTLQFDVYNPIQGERGSFTKTAMSGDNIIIKVSELGVDDVDPQRIAIKEDNFGKLVKFSNTGEASFIAPRQDMYYDIVLFDAYEGVNYNWMDEKNSKLYLGKHSYVVYRKDYDGQAGPDLGWIQWGYIDRRPNAGSGDFSYGYGYCYGYMGLHGGEWVRIEQSLTGTGPLTIATAEIFENITCTQNIGGGAGSWQIIIAQGGILNEVGKRLFAYVFAKE